MICIEMNAPAVVITDLSFDYENGAVWGGERGADERAGVDPGAHARAGDPGHSHSNPIFSSLNLRIESGEFLWIAGRNGIGKTTLLKLLAGILSPGKGSVVFEPRPSRSRTQWIGYVSQNPAAALFPWFTSEKNIAMPLFWAGSTRNAMRDAVSRIVERLGIQFDLTLHPHQLSGGQQQLVSLARALVRQPTLLLLDEPFKELDLEYRLRLAEILEDLAAEKSMTMVLSAHELETSLKLASRIVLLDGRPSRLVFDQELRSFATDEPEIVRRKLRDIILRDGTG